MTRQACLMHNLTLEASDKKLFSDLTFQLPYASCCGLIGRNGEGKSLLMATLAGERFFAVNINGSIQWQCAYAHLPQLRRLTQHTIAQALGIEKLASTFTRIEHGSADPSDYELVEHQWHLPGQWQQALEQASLPTELNFPVEQLSEGQKTRLALCRLFLLPEHYLLLDEPSNHLDAFSRIWLSQAIQRHPPGCLIISHDRSLLDQVHHIFSLHDSKLEHYTGNYTFYKEQYDLQTAALSSCVNQQKRELKQLRQQQIDTQAKSQKRQQMGKTASRTGSQAKIILNTQKERAGQSQARLTEQQTRQLDRAKQQLQKDLTRLEHIKPQQFAFEHINHKSGTILHLNNTELLYGWNTPINLTISSGEHIHLLGDNGSGKSTLLKTIHGILAPKTGTLYKSASSLYLDQNFSFLNPQHSAVENLIRLTSLNSELEWRTLLGQLRLRRDKAMTPLAQLSGGEQLKVALAAISHHQKEIAMLLLDEPENHLDIESRDLLANAIRQYTGAVLLVSHDPAFVTNCGIHKTVEMSHFQ